MTIRWLIICYILPHNLWVALSPFASLAWPLFVCFLIFLSLSAVARGVFVASFDPNCSAVFVSPPAYVIQDYFHAATILFSSSSTYGLYTHVCAISSLQFFISSCLRIIYRYILNSFTFFLSSCGNCPVACKLYLLSLVNFSVLTHQSSVSTPKKDKYVPGCPLLSIEIWTKYFNLSSESFACRNSSSSSWHVFRLH